MKIKEFQRDYHIPLEATRDIPYKQGFYDNLLCHKDESGEYFLDNPISEPREHELEKCFIQHPNLDLLDYITPLVNNYLESRLKDEGFKLFNLNNKNFFLDKQGKMLFSFKIDSWKGLLEKIDAKGMWKMLKHQRDFYKEIPTAYTIKGYLDADYMKPVLDILSNFSFNSYILSDVPLTLEKQVSNAYAPDFTGKICGEQERVSVADLYEEELNIGWFG